MADVLFDLEWENLDKAFRELELECQSVIRGMSVEFWYRILNQTPQYYGRMVASYSYSLGVPKFVDRSGQVYSEDVVTRLRYKGHLDAIRVADASSAGREKRFQLGSTIYISNGVEHGEGAYSDAVESAGVSLRAVNRPGFMVKRAVDYMVARYGRSVKADRAQYLKTLFIGSE